jgi:hypothetical protein
MNKIKVLPMLLLFFIKGALAHLCPLYNDVYVSGSWVSSIGAWHKQASFHAVGEGIGWMDINLDFTTPTNAIVYCYYNSATKCIPYKSTFNGIATPSGTNWVIYDDGSYHCNTDRNTCAF